VIGTDLAYSVSMVKLTVITKIQPGKKKEFLILLNGFQSAQGLIDCLIKEPGCLHYNFHTEGPHRENFVIESDWQSWEEMEAHFKNQHFKTLAGAIRVLCHKPEIRISDGTITAGVEVIEQLWTG
jgi:quinol monooxygenase YgiN